MSDDLVKRLRYGIVEHRKRWSGDTHADLGGSVDYDATTDMLHEAAKRIEALEAKLAKKDGCLDETYRRWKNGADLRALAKAEGCTQDRMRHKMKRYEEDKVRLLEDKLAKAAEALEWCAKADHSIMARFALAELKGKSDGL